MIKHTTKWTTFGLLAAIAWLPAAGADDPAAPAESPKTTATRPAGRERPRPSARPREQGRDDSPAFIGPRSRGLRDDLPRDDGARRDGPRGLREERPLSGTPRAAEPGLSLRPEQIDELMAFAERYFPEIHASLVRARRDNPGRFRQILRSMGPHLMEMVRASRENPQLAQTMIDIQRIEMRLRVLRQRYGREQSDVQRLAVTAELRRLLEQRFDLRMRRIELEIAALHRRLDRQLQNKERIIEQEYAQWFEPPPARPDGTAEPGPPPVPEKPDRPAPAAP